VNVGDKVLVKAERTLTMGTGDMNQERVERTYLWGLGT